MIEDLWYKNAIIYSLDVESFYDANGDGIGDFEGLTRRLDYLHSLGIDVIWLAPFQISPQRDNGYDIADYYSVDPRYGSNGDFVEFMHQATKRGIKVIIDLVVNHTSDEHRWFQEARENPDSKYHSWYIWSKKRPPNWNKGMVFPGVQKATWTRDPKAGLYYYHRFYEFQPDLDIDNPGVREEIRRIMGYWLELGVAGFRMDAVPFVIETTQPGEEQGTLHFEYIDEMRRFLQWRAGDAVLLGEANVPPEVVQKYFGVQGSGIHMMFNFFVNQHLFYALATGEIEPLIQALEATRQKDENSQWAQFLRNHDELDLERLPEEQRARVFERFGPNPEMQIYGRGIRRRLAPMLGDRSHIELAYSLFFSLPGTPVMRYGDEIGMGDDLRLREREAVRTPMQWSDQKNGGFSISDRIPHPVIDQGVYGLQYVNVEAQRYDPRSLLNWTTAMIKHRKECPEIGWGAWKILDSGNPAVLAMQYDWKGATLITLHNFDERPQEIQLKLDFDGGDYLVNRMSGERFRAGSDGIHRSTLGAYGYGWYRAIGAPPPAV